jgi:hypothetical protein
MKNFVAGAVAGFLISCAIAFASAGFEHNGTFWNKLTSDAKTGYVDGYNDAIQVSIGKLDSLTIAADLFHWKGARNIIHQVAREMSTSNIGTKQVVERLNALYGNSKYSELDLGSAFELLAVRPSSDTQKPPASKDR